jgi:nucleoside-diphosphate-sugar epimerase
MNILITGGTGYLGSHLVEKLHKDHSLFLLPRGDIHISDNIDLVIHLAGEINVSGITYSDSLIENNLHNTINLLDEMVKRGVKNLIYSSSMTVYSPDNQLPVTEKGKLQPCNFYGYTKKWTEEIIQHYANKGLVNSLILRIPGIYGGNRKGGYIYNTIQKALGNDDILIDNGNMEYWEAININDLNNMIIDLLTNCWWTNEVLNISYGEEIDFFETAFKIKEMTNSKSHINISNCDYKRFYLDNSKLKSLIDFNYSFDNGLRRYINEIRNR